VRELEASARHAIRAGYMTARHPLQEQTFSASCLNGPVVQKHFARASRPARSRAVKSTTPGAGGSTKPSWELPILEGFFAFAAFR
jgi:hypothetical protein